MKRINQYILTLLLAACVLPGMAQEQLSYENIADNRFLHYDFAQAAPLYEHMAAGKHPAKKVLYRLAYCYDMMQQYEKALGWYSAYLQLDSTADKDVLLRKGDLQRTLQQYAEARQTYRLYITRNGEKSRVINRIAGCDSAMVWAKHTPAVKLVNEENLNTPVADWGVSLYKQQLVFTSEYMRDVLSSREKSSDVYGRTGNHFSRLYLADPRWHNKADSSWQKQVLITGFNRAMNAYKYHVGPAAFSHNYDTVYFTVTYTGNNMGYEQIDTRNKLGTHRLELFFSSKDTAGNWKPARPFAYNNVKSFSTGLAALSKDGSILYFTSDRPGGMGGTDIWYCEKQADGEWGEPKNCGSAINTPENEVFPTMGSNNELYFSSTGHAGLGGLDLFSAAGSRQNWKQPVNLQPPFNSGYDDFYFTETEQGGYLSSDRPGGQGGDDIYSFVKPAPEKPKPAPLLVLTGIVYNAKDSSVIPGASIWLTDIALQQNWLKHTEPTGAALFLVQTRQQYLVEAAYPGFSTDSLSLQTADVLLHDDTLYAKLYLHSTPLPVRPLLIDTPYKRGDSVVLQNLYYDLDKSNIRPDAALVLDRLVDVLNRFPTMHISLGAHTDSRGSDAYNLELSRKRAASAVQYLVSKGISKSRLQSFGYGETQLLNRCANGVPCAEKEHQVNRRSVVTITQE